MLNLVACEASSAEVHRAERAVITAVASVLDAVYDPCALARGQRIGLVSAALVQCVRLRPAPDGEGLCVEVHASTTASSCLMYVYFEREVRRGLLGNSDIATIDFEWRFGHGKLDTSARTVSTWIQEQDAQGWSTWRPESPGGCAGSELDAPRSSLGNADVLDVNGRAAQ